MRCPISECRAATSISGASSSKAQVNWRRGFFRVWLLASGAWIMSWVLWLMIYGISRGFRDMHEVFAVPVLLFGPPVALMLFGLVAGWAFRGFKPDEEEKRRSRFPNSQRHSGTRP